MKNKPAVIISTYDDIKNPHYGGGGAIAVHEIAKRLKNKYAVTILSWDYSGKKFETIDGIHYQRFGHKSLSPKAAMFAYQLALPFQVMKHEYDLWLESFCPPFTTAMLPLFTKKPVVGIVHMLASEDMERKYKLPFHLIENYGLKKYKNILATSAYIKEKIQSVHKSGVITTISNGIDKVAMKSMKKEKYVLFLGRIEIDQKGLDLLIPAFKQFNTLQNNTYKLVIAGNGDIQEINKVKAMLKNYELTKYVSLIGRIQGVKKTEMLQKATCIVVPSRFETFSLVALEALAYGTPLICFSIKGLSWVSNKFATKVPSIKFEALAKALANVVSDKKQTRAKAIAGKIFAKQFTWDAIGKQYESYISSLL